MSEHIPERIDQVLAPDNRPAPDDTLTGYFRDLAGGMDEATDRVGKPRSYQALFDRCMQFHSENEMLRVTFRQTYVLVQAQLNEQATARKVVAEELKKLDSGDIDYIAKYRVLLALQRLPYTLESLPASVLLVGDRRVLPGAPVQPREVERGARYRELPRP